jgi:cation diffusion facilitator CzcD-associated flavoprotein CzcO
VPARATAPVAGRKDLADIVSFHGPVVTSAEALRHPVPTEGTIACIGTDQAMVDLLGELVRGGARIKVFEDRPRLVLPDGMGLCPRPAAVLRAVSVPVEVLGRVVPLPALRRARTTLRQRSGSLHRRRSLRDPWVRRQLTPSSFDRRRALGGDSYYAALASPACQVISWPVARITPTGVRTCDGLEHRVDRIIVAS